MYRVPGLALLLLPGLFAQTITAVQNAASNIPAGPPNSSIAQGSMFVIKGTGLGPDTFAIADAFPFQSSIAGTSVNVTVGGRTLSALMYYAGAAQVAAILPSGTPAGNGTVTVTYGGRTSPPAPVTVVQNNLGIFSVNQTGAGDAVATLGPTFVSAANAAHPGEIVGFWGSGLGPVPYDEAAPAQQEDLLNIPVEAFIGGHAARVVFRGRNACCTAIDTVYAEIPADVSGCAVPVTFKIGNLVSNTTSIAVAPNGRTCTPSLPGVSVDAVNIWLANGGVSVASFSLAHTTATGIPTTIGGVTVPAPIARQDTAQAAFYRAALLPGAVGLGAAFDIPPYGSCSVSLGSSGAAEPIPYPVRYLDAGASIAVNGPGGARTLTKQNNQNTFQSVLDPQGNYFVPGDYTLTPSGGADIGSFTAPLAYSSGFAWTNQAASTTVNRANGVIVNWNGADPNGYVLITGSNSVSASSSLTVAFTCTVRPSDGTFTVPDYILRALPPSASTTVGGITLPVPGTLVVSSISAPQSFQAPAVDLAYAAGIVALQQSVNYQ